MLAVCEIKNNVIIKGDFVYNQKETILLDNVKIECSYLEYCTFKLVSDNITIQNSLINTANVTLMANEIILIYKSEISTSNSI